MTALRCVALTVLWRHVLARRCHNWAQWSWAQQRCASAVIAGRIERRAWCEEEFSAAAARKW
jgi:hypothetical protein